MNTARSIKEQLAFEYKYRIEMHAHTSPASPCSEILPEEMAEIYHGKKYDAIVITNHFVKWIYKDCEKEEALDKYLKDYEDTVRAAEKYGLKVILGAEMRFAENMNDYLVYGVNRDILSKLYDHFDSGLEVFRREVSLPDSVILQAHPFRRDMVLADPKLLDGIEALNMHPGHNSAVGLATRYAYENGFGIITAGSDFHHKGRGHEAVSALRTKVLPEDSFEFAKLLKSGDYILEIGENAIVLP